MLNYLWGGMIIIAVIYGAFTGNISEVTNAAVNSSLSAVELCITMAGVVSLWMGIMEAAQKAGLLEKVRRILKPFIRFMFPDIPEGHKSADYIADSFAANILGLGWAATPAGLKAMKELERLEEERKSEGYTELKEKTDEKSDRGVKEKTYNKVYRTGSKGIRMASDEMCTFLTLNISSLQLIPVNMIAYRSQYGSANPTGIVGPAIITTLFSTTVAVIYCKIRCIKRKHI